MRVSRISDSATRERQLRESAACEAADLFATYGESAIDIVAQRAVDGGRSPEQRRSDRLALLTIERLDRERRQGSTPAAMPTALVVWKPPLFSRSWFASLFRKKVRHRRR